LPENAGSAQPAMGTPGRAGFGRAGYGGPCPPGGSPHRYFFRIYAVDLAPDLAQGLNSAQLQNAIQGKILAEGELMGTYKR